MEKDEIIRQLQAVIAQREREIELLRARIRHLEAQLANYENAHTPPSLRRGGMRKASLWIESVLLRCCTWMKRQSRSRERSTGSGHSPHQPAETFVVIRKSRGTNVLMEVLTRRFKGLIVCDGWKPHAVSPRAYSDAGRAHLLRESKALAGKSAEAVPLHKALTRLYKKLNAALEEDTPPNVRRRLWYEARATLRRWLRREHTSEKVVKFIGKIANGFAYWFSFVIINQGVEPTNNRAERALREHVVQRKIVGTLRNEKGTSIHERIMTVLATWTQQGLNSFQMLRAMLGLNTYDRNNEGYFLAQLLSYISYILVC